MKKAHEEYPQLILDSAKKIAFEEGLSAVNVRSVALRANVSVGTIYNYYATKEALIVGILKDFWSNVFKNIHLDCHENDVDFFVKMEELYLAFYGYMNQFEERFLKQLDLFNNVVLQESKIAETTAFTKIEEMLIKVMDQDERLRRYPFDEGFSKADFSHLVFHSMIDYLKAKQPTFIPVITMFKKMFD